jgi:hypothetical protein
MLKNTIRLLAAIIFSFSVDAQAPPDNTNNGSAGQNSPSFWSRAGNSGSGNNLFGTQYNSPVYTITGNGFSLNGNTYRMKVNANYSNNTNQYPINGYIFSQGVNTTGYVLMGTRNTSIADSRDIYSQKGAFSQLHLNGEGSNFQEFGYRPWMKTGITLTANRDLSYLGMRKLSTNPNEEDITETVFLWSDNASTSAGPDKLVFRFSGFGGNNGNTVSNDRLSNTDLDALHVAQFTGVGLMGLGNTFGTNAAGMSTANYIDPQSLLHMSYDWRGSAANERFGFLRTLQVQVKHQMMDYVLELITLS